MTKNYVIISGSTGGIGYQIAKLALKDENVVKCGLIYRNEEKFQNCFSAFNSEKIQKIKIDMEKLPDKSSHILSESYDNVSLKVVLAASTIVPIEHITSLKPEQIIKNININLVSQINLISSIIQDANMLKMNVGIINLNSGAAYRPLSGWSLYSGSKAYMNIFLKTLVKENDNVVVVSYDPGVVDTPMQSTIRNTDKKIFDEVDTFQKYKSELQLNNPEDVAIDIFNRYILNWTANNFEEKYSLK